MKRLVSDYGMLGALLLLCAFFSWRTWDEQHPTGEAAGQLVASAVEKAVGGKGRVLIAARDNDEDRLFTSTLSNRLSKAGLTIVSIVHGEPADARRAMNAAVETGGGIDVIACNHATAAWPVFKGLAEKIPQLAHTVIIQPRSYHWPNFLKTDNLLNIANQIVVIAIIAIGMTLVIITGGIDLSVGSIVALSAVVTTWLIARVAGAEQASVTAMILACAAGVAVGAAMGLFSGVMITGFAIPPFIVTLAMMLVGSGFAYLLARGESIYQIPESFIWLGRGTVAGVPNSVVLMLVLYFVAHVVMSRMALGRYVYAVGGNREAARLSGVPVVTVLLLAYTLSGALAGLGGVITASQLKSGSPNYGTMYELYVIAAVVVGGTSLSGGEGKIFGTLIGAFIIAVIQNGMNLTGVESYTQKVVLGLVILGAVLLDMLKKRGWFRRTRIAREAVR
ncbi:MAG: ABC transporter permease [Verrucomicrobia bacterium]|nr:ABC transporter permease [Verrucomicrobiota bacterium]